MSCFKPLYAQQNNQTKEMIWGQKPSLNFKQLNLPCGQCSGCRVAQSSDWAIRIQHESQQYLKNSFITFTYDEDNLPSDSSLHKRDFQLLMKRLRKTLPMVINPETEELEQEKIRFFHCGEYGEKTNRPHYHACFFNYDPPDKILYSESNGNKLYTSKTLSNLWGKGIVVIGTLNETTAAYTARYVIKKVNGDLAKKHYECVNPITGEITQLKPEYITMSNRPGIGLNFLSEFINDIYPHDKVINSKFKETRVPKYYDRKLKEQHPEYFEKLKAARIEKAKLRADENTPKRLNTREICFEAKLKQLNRGL